MKYHHFREAVQKGHLKVTRVVTIEQLADIFTKALAKKPLEYLRGKIMGWPAMLSTGSMKEATFQTYRKAIIGF